MEKNLKLLPDKIYAWNYVGCFNTGLGLPVVDMGDTPWSEYIRADLATYNPNTHALVPLEALMALTPFEIVGGDSIKRTNPHFNVNLNSGCHWAVSNGDRPAYKLRDAIAKLNAAAQKGETK